MDVQSSLDEQLHRLFSIIPSRVLVPVIISVLTLITAAAVSSKSIDKDVYDAPERHVLKIEELWHYPVKGLGGIRLQQGTIGAQGFEDDRTFCLEKIHRNKESGEINDWETMYPGFNLQTVLLQSIVEGLEKGPHKATITVTRTDFDSSNPKQRTFTGKSEHQVQFALRPDVRKREKIYLNLHGSASHAYDMGQEISDWFSTHFGFETRLVYMGDHVHTVLGSGAPNGDLAIAKRNPVAAAVRKWLPKVLRTPVESIAFHDMGQYLVVTKESNDEISSRFSAGRTMDIHKFRPNIIFSGAAAACDEDYWAQLVFPGNFKMDFGGTCWRSQAITVDYQTGKKAEGEEGEVWKKLSKDRRVDKGWKYGPVFGKYAYTSLKDVGRTLEVGSEAVLKRRVRERPIFDWPMPKAVIDAFA